MKYFVIGEIQVTDPSWVQDYLHHVTAIVERFGGKYLARTGNVEHLEGEASSPPVFVLIEWPDKDSALEFYRSPEYAPYLQKRLAGSTGQLVLVAQEDMARPASGSEVTDP